jgi:phosphatidylinositol alpha-mannosyltransferase
MFANKALSIAIVYDDSLDRPGGVAQHIEMLRRGLGARGHNVHVLVGETRSKDSSCRSLARNVCVRFNGNALTVPLFASATQLDLALAEIAPDVLHVQLPYSPLLAGRLLTRAHPRTAVVGTSHVFSECLPVRLGARFLASVNARTSRRFDRVLAVSDTARTFAEDYSRISVDAVVPNSVDVAAIRKATKDIRRSTEPTVAFVGNLVPRKGVDRLLAAWPSVLVDVPTARLLIAGDGPQRRMLQRTARRTGVGPTVQFLGQVDETRKAHVLAEADVACFPSLFGESFGVVLLEAMAAGTPVVLGGNNAGYQELLGARPGSLVNPRDPGRLAQALTEGLREARDSELRWRWQRHLVARYDVAVVTEQILDQYRRALALRCQLERERPAGARAA